MGDLILKPRFGNMEWSCHLRGGQKKLISMGFGKIFQGTTTKIGPDGTLSKLTIESRQN